MLTVVSMLVVVPYWGARGLRALWKWNDARGGAIPLGRLGWACFLGRGRICILFESLRKGHRCYWPLFARLDGGEAGSLWWRSLWFVTGMMVQYRY